MNSPSATFIFLVALATFSITFVNGNYTLCEELQTGKAIPFVMSTTHDGQFLVLDWQFRGYLVPMSKLNLTNDTAKIDLSNNAERIKMESDYFVMHRKNPPPPSQGACLFNENVNSKMVPTIAWLWHGKSIKPMITDKISTVPLNNGGNDVANFFVDENHEPPSYVFFSSGTEANALWIYLRKQKQLVKHRLEPGDGHYKRFIITDKKMSTDFPDVDGGFILDNNAAYGWNSDQMILYGKKGFMVAFEDFFDCSKKTDDSSKTPVTDPSAQINTIVWCLGIGAIVVLLLILTAIATCIFGNKTPKPGFRKNDLKAKSNIKSAMTSTGTGKISSKIQLKSFMKSMLKSKMSTTGKSEIKSQIKSTLKSQLKSKLQSKGRTSPGRTSKTRASNSKS